MNSERTQELRISTLRKLEEIFGPSGILPEGMPVRIRGLEDKSTLFVRDKFGLDPALLEEAASYGLDASEIARAAVERAVKTERMKRFSEDNREAFASHARDVEENGLWSDGLRLF